MLRFGGDCWNNGLDPYEFFQLFQINLKGSFMCPSGGSGGF
jgi:hypothetical protein